VLPVQILTAKFMKKYWKKIGESTLNFLDGKETKMPVSVAAAFVVPSM